MVLHIGNLREDGQLGRDPADIRVEFWICDGELLAGHLECEGLGQKFGFVHIGDGDIAIRIRF